MINNAPITLDWLEDKSNGFFMLDGDEFQLHFAPIKAKGRKGEDFWNCILSFSRAGYTRQKETGRELTTIQDLIDLYKKMEILI